MGGMNPFEQPPVGAPVSVEPPVPSSGPRRGRMALVVVLTAGLIGGGIAGVSQLASADRPELAVSATDDPADETIPPVDDETDDPAAPGEPDEPAFPIETDGEIVFDTGDGDPIVIDLGDFASGDLGELSECLGLPLLDFDFEFGDWEPGEWEPGEFPIGDLDEFLEDLPFDDLPFDLDALEEWEPGEFGAFDLDGSVTVTGPDGVSVVDLGENGSVTITKQDGDVTISTEGDATVSEIEDLFGDFGGIFDGEFEFGEFDEGAFDEFLETLPNFDERAFPTLDELPDFEPIDPDAVESCLDEFADR